MEATWRRVGGLTLGGILVCAAPLAGQALRVRVRDAVNGRGVAGATVVLVGRRTTVPRRGVTDVEGRASFELQPADTFSLTVAAFGYDPLVVTLIPAERVVVEAPVWLMPSPIELPGLEATAHAAVVPPRTPLMLRGFYERRAKGFGTFLGPEELKDVSAVDLGDYLRRVPSVQLLAGGEAVFRRGTGRLDADLHCLPAIVLDGLVLRMGGDTTGPRLNDIASWPEVAAIEAYAGPAGVPPEYAGTGAACGVILIWTRR